VPPIEAELLARDQLDILTKHVAKEVVARFAWLPKVTLYILDRPPQVFRMMVQSQKGIVETQGQSVSAPGTQIATLIAAKAEGGEPDPSDQSTFYLYVKYDLGGGSVDQKDNPFLAKPKLHFNSGIEISYFLSDSGGVVINSGEPYTYSGLITAPKEGLGDIDNLNGGSKWPRPPVSQ
jgi:hypothetical protein